MIISSSRKKVKAIQEPIIICGNEFNKSKPRYTLLYVGTDFKTHEYMTTYDLKEAEEYKRDYIDVVDFEIGGMNEQTY